MKDCCANEDNRQAGFGPRGDVGIELAADREDVRVTHCTVCECRHISAEADPGHFGLRGASLA